MGKNITFFVRFLLYFEFQNSISMFCEVKLRCKVLDRNNLRILTQEVEGSHLSHHIDDIERAREEDSLQSDRHQTPSHLEPHPQAVRGDAKSHLLPVSIL